MNQTKPMDGSPDPDPQPDMSNRSPAALRLGARRPGTRCHAGFTLIEIMIVVSIIGALAAVAIPSYLRSRLRTQMTTCIINLQNIEGAVEQWAMEGNKAADQAVKYSDISPYLKRRVVCPAGGTSFDDSYQLTRIDSQPVCLRSPGGEYAHKLPF